MNGCGCVSRISRKQAMRKIQDMAIVLEEMAMIATKMRDDINSIHAILDEESGILFQTTKCMSKLDRISKIVSKYDEKNDTEKDKEDADAKDSAELAEFDPAESRC